MGSAVNGGRNAIPAPISFFGILIAALVVRMVIALVSGGDPIAGAMTYRPFVEACHVGPAVLAMLSLEYGCILLVFVLFRKSWPGKGAVKGIIFGAAFGFLWFYGMLEAAFALGTSFFHEFLFGISEMPAILLLGFLAGKIFASDEVTSSDQSRVELNTGSNDGYLTAVMIALFLGAGRFFSYAVAKVEPAWQTLSYTIWTIGFALLVGVIYFVLGKNLPGKGLQKGLLFGFFVFGLNWMLFNLFVPYLFIVPLADILHNFILRVVLDCTYIAVGIVVASFVRKR